jgi:hypothetical protein
MSAAFPIIKCSKCGAAMHVGYVQATKTGNDVTYECVLCRTTETVSIPKPGGTSPKPPSAS